MIKPGTFQLKFSSTVQSHMCCISVSLVDGDREVATATTGCLDNTDPDSTHATPKLAASNLLEVLRRHLQKATELMMQERLIAPNKEIQQLAEELTMLVLSQVIDLRRRLMAAADLNEALSNMMKDIAPIVAVRLMERNALQ